MEQREKIIELLKGKQVYFAKEIVNIDMKTLINSGEVVRVTDVVISEPNNANVKISLWVEGGTRENFTDEHFSIIKDDIDQLMNWVGKNLVPVDLMYDLYFRTIGRWK